MLAKGINKSLLALVFVLLSFTGCDTAEDSDSLLVQVYVHPAGPASVKNSPFTTIIAGNEFTVNPPWFFITLSGFNGTDRELFVASMEVSCENNSGFPTDWSPVLEEGVVGIAVAPANEQFIWGPRTSGNSVSGASSMIAYVGDLSASGNLNYRCEMVLEGWYMGAEDDPETDVDETTLPGENFRKRLTFSAREF